MRSLIVCLLVGSSFALSGCSTGNAQITFRKEAPTVAASARNVYEDFPGAYITSNRDGEYDVLLVNDTLRAAPEGHRKKPLNPIAEPPLQQAVHIHIFWRPTNGAMVHESSITNAIVHWYVFSTDSAKGSDMIHYEGAAFVKLATKGDRAEITIGDGEVSPKEVRGGLKDPVGPSHISGLITAVKNDARVRELLGNLQDKVAGNDHYWTEARGDEGSPFGR
jgi:hypothetical protein